ncbi:MAG: hypothetical protein E7454_08210 [Ruminococcaceae bacterium]|nr:hypothetical protein [Oscillospiraceae bacterium]
MKRWFLYLALLAAAAFLTISPFQGSDVAKLLPIETVWLAQEKGTVSLKTDTGDLGRGETVAAALQDMKESASGTVFLDTADYLIVEKGSEELLTQIYHILRPSCMVCIAENMPDLEQVTAYFNAHEPPMTLRRFQNGGEKLPILTKQEGRFKWLE